MRESTCKKEQAFIVKNRPFLETNRLLNSNTHHYNDDLAESNSIWLKAKGDEFYKRKDCSSAVNPCMRAFEQSSTNLINITDGRGMWRCHSCFALIELPSSRRDLKSLRRKIFDGRSPWRLFDLSAIDSTAPLNWLWHFIPYHAQTGVVVDSQLLLSTHEGPPIAKYNLFNISASSCWVPVLVLVAPPARDELLFPGGISLHTIVPK